MEYAEAPTTTWGAAVDRYRWVSEFALAATALAEPTTYDDGLRLHEAATAYASFHAWSAAGPLDIRVVTAHPEFAEQMDHQQDDGVVSCLQRLYNGIASHKAEARGCTCVLHAGAAFDTGQDIGWLVKLAGRGSESADVLAHVAIRHPWGWVADAALAAVELADVSATDDGLELTVQTVGALAHYASSRQARLLRGTDAFTPDALDAYAASFRWAIGWNMELDRLIGALVTMHVAESPDCQCGLCTPALADFGTFSENVLAVEGMKPHVWVVVVATDWGLLTGADARLVLVAARTAAYEVLERPRVVTEGIDIDRVARRGPQTGWMPAGDSIWRLCTALTAHKFASHCACVLCGSDRGY